MHTSELMHYSELCCRTNFSFLQAASHPEDLVQQAQALGYQSIAITDECSLAGIAKAYSAARNLQFSLIVGSLFCTASGLNVIVIATSRIAYAHLSQLITRCRRHAPKGQYTFKVEWLDDLHQDCLFIWKPCHQHPLTDDAQHLISKHKANLWIGLTLHEDAEDLKRCQTAIELQQLIQRPLVACGDIRQHDASCQPLLDTVTAIRLNTPLSQCGFALPQGQGHTLRTRPQLQALYPPALIAETQRIQARCDFDLGALRYEYPTEIVPEGFTATQYLNTLVEQGLQQRYPHGPSDKVRKLVAKELALIHELQYAPYFLTVYDVVSFARARGILCQGRGSAANSAICFCLGITEVDPEHFSTLFERFISKERNEPPDIDVDFEHERREEVIQFIYKKYGTHRAALVATVITYRIKSALRDVGKALDVDASILDHVTQSLAWWDKRQHLQTRLQEVGLSLNSQVTQQWLTLVEQLLTFPRHLSQHVGGFIIARGPLADLVPIENTAMANRTVVQWDKDDVEALGLLKVDVLALGMLTMIRKAFTLIQQQEQRMLSIATLPAEDPAVYALLQRADTIGIFQVESRAQMSMLPRLKPKTFYDIAIEVAIVRPGPIQGQMVHPYLRRRQGLEPVTYPSKTVQSVLARTLGVPLFQEQVIELAMVAADFSAGEADLLRRAMGSWRKRGELEHYQQKLMLGLTKNGYDAQFAARLIEQINGFGEYGFPESHAISFALLVYASAWLKQHYPAAFYCALLNSQPMGFYTPSQLVQDAKRHGLSIYPPDVCHSDWDHTLVPNTHAQNSTQTDQRPPQPSQPGIRLGLRLIKGLPQKEADKICFVRKKTKFCSIDHLSKSADLKRATLTILARADALRTLSGHRHAAHWQAAGIEPARPLLQHSAPEPQTLTHAMHAPSETENVTADYHHIGLSLRTHPVALLRQNANAQQAIVQAAQSYVEQSYTEQNHAGKSYAKQSYANRAKRTQLAWHSHIELTRSSLRQPVYTAGLVTCRQRPSTAQGIVFLTLEDETGNTNIVIKPQVLQTYRQALLNSRFLGVIGHLEKAGIVMHLIAHHLIQLDHHLSTLTLRSRDFH